MDNILNFLVWAAVLLIPLLAIGCARAARGFGRQVAVTRLTDVANSSNTIREQVRAFGKSGLFAIIMVAGVIALFLFVSATWGPFVGSIVGFGANLALGLAAGIGLNVGEILSKPDQRENINVQLEMKNRTRRRLRQYLPILFVLFVLPSFNMLYASEPVWIVAIDASNSVDPVQREEAIESLVRTAPSRARDLDVSAVLVVEFSDKELLSDMRLIPVPDAIQQPDCSNAKPSLQLSKSLVAFSPTFLAARKRDAVAECGRQQTAVQRSNRESEALFRNRLRAASVVSVKNNVRTHLVGLLRGLVSRRYVRAIDVISDGIDNSGVPISRVVTTSSLQVTLIITGPNPERASPTLRDVLEAAEAWDRIDGVTVTTVAEYAGFSKLAEAR